MFTGIVETIGTIKEANPYDASESGGHGYSLVISGAEKVLSDCHIGDSISVSGVCLTVTEFTSSEFKVGIAPETLDRTYLGNLKPGNKVNLERAVSASTRMGGHTVQGHVDVVADIVERKSDDNSLRMSFKPRGDPDETLQYVVEKGFIALDGTSLTITEVTDTTFSVMLIAHTQQNVTLGFKQVGDPVNVEVDVTGKLVAKLVSKQVERQVEREVERRIAQLNRS